MGVQVKGVYKSYKVFQDFPGKKCFNFLNVDKYLDEFLIIVSMWWPFFASLLSVTPRCL